MVGPVSDEEREAFLRRVKIGFVLVVGLSGALMALRVDAGLPGLALGAGAGMVAGVIVVWIAFPDQLGRRPGSSRRRGRR